MVIRHASSAPLDDAFSDDESATARVRVLLPLPLEGAYDYKAARGVGLAPGDFVRVPLGSRHVNGVVWDDVAKADDSVPDEKLKKVAERLDVPPMSQAMRRFVEWVAAYTMTPPGAVLRMAMSVEAALERPRPLPAFALSPLAPDHGAPQQLEPRLTAARRTVLRCLRNGGPQTGRALAEAAGVGSGVLRGMVELGWLDPTTIERPAPPVPDGTRHGPALSDDQHSAAAALQARLDQGFSVTLLDGVTGSGKTEVYFEAIAAAIARGKQVLVLLPEIAMSAQWLARFEQRFGAPPAAWHSEIGQAARCRSWRNVAEGRAPVVVGARSALFLPFPDLGLIVVDEEHEAAFKQEDGVVYHARDMAVVRARIGQLPIVLVSATPSLETVINVAQGRYQAVHLPDRHGGAALPDVETIDLRQDQPPRQSWLSSRLRTSVAETLAAGEQAMLFLNRRGYAPLTLCRTCGHRLQCPSCTAWLVEHRLVGKLQCHHCGFAMRPPKTCASCGDTDSFAVCGPGVERIAEEAAALFPEAKIEIITSDTIAGPETASAFVARMANKEIDLLVGTQIVAKGHHFPMLTLVGVVDADLGLAGGDLRAAERTYQLLHQVAGRAGRAGRPGRVLLQTHMPEHPVMRALVEWDRDRFLAAEAEERLRLGLPPFGRLAAVILASPDEPAVDDTARRLARVAPRASDLEVLGPAPAPLAILRGRHRRRFLVKASRSADIQGAIAAWLQRVEIPTSVRLYVDIDPYSFL
ncbi:MAG TPA: primosomal protein N' [Alphaproteobacteria bacterium]|nr:primosomal protein N' [Alphaproteobacteria bacterium]